MPNHRLKPTYRPSAGTRLNRGVGHMNRAAKLGFVVSYTPRAGLSARQHSALLQAFIEEAIEANELIAGGGGARKMRFFISPSRAQLRPKQRAAVCRWLKAQPKVRVFSVGAITSSDEAFGHRSRRPLSCETHAMPHRILCPEHLPLRMQQPGRPQGCVLRGSRREAKHWGCDLPSTPNRLLSGTADNAEQCQRIRAHYETACQ